MTDSVIGALRVVLGADTAALDRGLKDSQASLADFGSSVGIGMAAVAAAVAAAAFSILGSVKSVINSADQLNSLSQSVGVSVEELSKLGYAASLSGVGIEQLGNTLGKLTKAMSSAASEGAGPAAQAFTALSISVKNQDGTLKSSSDVLGEIADKFATYRDGAAKTALAIALFGEAGTRLIPMLNQGRDGLSDLGKEAEGFGLVLDKRTTMAAAAFHENLKKLDAINQGLYTTIAAKLLPSLEALSSQYLESSKSSDLFARAAGKIADIINTVIREVMIGVIEVNAMVTQFSNLFTSLQQIWSAPKADWAKIWGDYKTANDAVAASAEGAAASIKAATGAIDSAGSTVDWLMQAQAIKSMNREVVAYAESWKASAPTIAAATSSALQNFLDSQQKHIAAQNADADAVGKNVGEQAKLRVQYQANAIALAKNIPITADMQAKITATGDAAAAAALKLQGMTLAQSLMTPWDQRALQLQQYTAALTAAGAGTDAFAAASLKVQFPAFYAAQQAAQDFGAQIDQLATSAVNGLSSALASVIMGTKSAAEAFKAFAVQVITDLVAMIIKAIAFKAIMTAIGFSGGGGIGNLFMGGGSPTGFDSGGAVIGPGTGTSDSIPAMLSNGEFVVNAAATKQFAPLLQAINSGNLPSFKDGGDVSGGSNMPVMAARSAGKTVILQGFAWSRDQMPALFEFINEGLADDHKLNFKFA